MARSATTKAKRKGRGAASGGAGKCDSEAGPGRRREILGVVLLALGLTLVLALWSFTPQDRVLLEEGYPATHNLIGPAGHHLAGTLLAVIGLGAFVVAAALLAGALACFVRRRVHLGVIETSGYFVLMVFGATLAHLSLGEMRPFSHAPGGAVGAVAGEMLRSWLNTTGAVIVASAVAVLALMVASDFTVARLCGTAGRGLLELFSRLGPVLRSWWALSLQARAERRVIRLERRREKEEARRIAKEEKRLLAAKLREEGEMEADERGLVPVAGREPEEPEELEEKPKGKGSRREDHAPKAQRKAAESSPSPERSARDRSAREHASAGRAIEHAAARRINDLPVIRHASPAATIAPVDEADVYFDLAPVDPLADPTWADPEWAGGLFKMRETRSGEGPLLPGSWRMEPPEEASTNTEEPAGGETAEEPDSLIQIRKKQQPAPAQSQDEKPEKNAKKTRSTKSEEIAPVRALAEKNESLPEEKAAVVEREPTIIAPKPQAKPAPKPATQETFAYMAHGEKFVLPSLDFFSPIPENLEADVDRDALVDTARRLTEKLEDFGIAGEVVQIRPGPVITMYEFRPGPGVKISKIQGLSDDLAMAMEALRVRIVAPIPGKNAVGIEVPNAKRQMVCMREIVEQESFRQSKSKLTLALGQNIEGDPVIVDLAKMPHLLIAGTTGSGKSVAVNGMITSMLYKATPDEVRFIMIDPKVLELKLYEGIPHLLLPVVTDPAKAALALRWATEEMDRRYHLLADLNVRDLATFNRKVTRMRGDWEARQEGLPPLPPIESVDGDAMAHEDLRRQHEERWLSDPPPPERLPMLVIVIDELADLMMVASREVETYIARLAQKARAAGIHLLVATQRPSTDVLTGVIKINFPARISFRVASRHDSQTIINAPGAEKLLGNGDMLIIPPGQSEPMRAHGAFLSEGEIEKVVEHLKTQGKPVYDESILQPRDEAGAGGDDDDEAALDAKWDDAIAILSDRDTISVSWIQRRLAIGYNRAARMIEKMEREGLVGPADGSKPREVLMGTLPP